ncbi:exported hypothetical protein [Acidobacteriia bacterium SbA2]|nr:exported hypothetical protein [Acidobacteriia bacterium SbA2]
MPGRSTSFRKSTAASCSKCSRARMLLLVSINIPMRRGRSVSRLKKRTSWGLPSSKILKSSLVRSVTSRFFLSVTVASIWTNSTRTWMRLWSPAIGGLSAAGLAGTAGGCWARTRPSGKHTNKRAKNSVFIRDFSTNSNNYRSAGQAGQFLAMPRAVLTAKLKPRPSV